MLEQDVAVAYDNGRDAKGKFEIAFSEGNHVVFLLHTAVSLPLHHRERVCVGFCTQVAGLAPAIGCARCKKRTRIQ